MSDDRRQRLIRISRSGLMTDVTISGGNLGCLVLFAAVASIIAAVAVYHDASAGRNALDLVLLDIAIGLAAVVFFLLTALWSQSSSAPKPSTRAVMLSALLAAAGSCAIYHVALTHNLNLLSLFVCLLMLLLGAFGIGSSLTLAAGSSGGSVGEMSPPGEPTESGA